MDYTALEAALKRIKDDINVAISTSSPRLRPHLELAREQIGNAQVQLEMVVLKETEATKGSR